MPKFCAKWYSRERLWLGVPSTLPLRQRGVGGCRWQRAHVLGFPDEAPTGETGLESFDEPTAVAPGT